MTKRDTLLSAGSTEDATRAVPSSAVPGQKPRRPKRRRWVIAMPVEDMETIWLAQYLWAESGDPNPTAQAVVSEALDFMRGGLKLWVADLGLTLDEAQSLARARQLP